MYKSGSHFKNQFYNQPNNVLYHDTAKNLKCNIIKSSRYEPRTDNRDSCPLGKVVKA